MEFKFDINENSTLPLYRQLSHELQKMIQSFQMKQDEPLPSLKTLAHAGGVSLGTMDAAITELINLGICYRRPKKGTFVGAAPTAMRSMVWQEQKVIAVYAPNFEILRENMVMHPVDLGVEEEAQKNGVGLMRITGDLTCNVEKLWNHQTLNLIGIVVLFTPNPEQLLKLARKYVDLRFALTNYKYSGLEFAPHNLCGVFNEEFAGGYVMTDYLLRKGHSKVAVISAESTGTNYQERIDGWRAAMKDHGQEPDDTMVEVVKHEELCDGRVIGMRGMKALLRRLQPDAVFCLNDLFAAGAYEYLRMNGQLGAIEFAGFDNYISDISRSYQFATVAVDYERMGVIAVRQLLNMCDNIKTVLLAPKLIPRNCSAIESFIDKRINADHGQHLIAKVAI